MDRDTFYQYEESQAQAGYRSAVLYKEQGDTKYRFLCASETVPFPFGTKETFEYNLLNSGSIGQVEGKSQIEQKEIELLYTRNNAMLFETLRGRVLDFMSITPQKIGYKYHGKISFRPNDATNDIHRGTYTITPMGANEVPLWKARNECLEPLFFADVIPDEINMSNIKTETIPLNLSLVNNYASAKYSYATVGEDNNVGTTETDITVDKGIGNIPKSEGLYVIYARPAEGDKEKYSSCFTTVYVNA